MRWFTVLIAALTILGAALAAPGTARANWENTRWGMTPAQVKALYPAAVEAPASEDRRYPMLQLNQPVKVNFITWSKVVFLFERGGGLTSVMLYPAETAADIRDDQIGFYLMMNFGPAVEMTGTEHQENLNLATYRAGYLDSKSGDEVWFNVLKLMGAQLRFVEHRAPDPAEVARRKAAQRLMLLRDRGEAPLPAGGWNNTRWTMSREQVLALYPAARQDDLGRLTVAGPFTWAGRTWQEIAFQFEPDYGLASVYLWTTRAELGSLEAEARARFGPPTATHGKADDATVSFYVVDFPDTSAGESVELFSTRLQTDQGTGLRICAPDDSAAQRAAMAARDPGPPPLALRWDMTPAEFKTAFPAAGDTTPDIQFLTLAPVSLYGRTWKRGLFHFTYGGLEEFHLFSTDSYETILAAMTSLYGPPEVRPNGAMVENDWTDNVTRSYFRLTRVFDGTANLSVMKKLG